MKVLIRKDEPKANYRKKVKVCSSILSVEDFPKKNEFEIRFDQRAT